jgi:gamma-glutamylputrescine oxidase
MTQHAPSYYAATANRQTARLALTTTITTEICIIGAGFTGISAALELAAKNIPVVVLESVRVGFGASGRNGGQIVNGYSRDLDVIADRYGPGPGKAIGAMALEGGAIIRERVKKYAIKCDLTEGGLFCAFSQKQLEGLRHHKKIWSEYGHQAMDILDHDQMQNHVVTTRYVGALLDHLGGHIHPLNLVQGEAEAAESHGATIYENSPAIAIENGQTPVVKTPNGEVRCKTILVCGNAYLGNLLPEITARIMPVTTQIIATEPLGDEAAKLLPSNVCVEDANYVLDYYRRTPDTRILYGGGIVYGGTDSESITAKIRPNMLKTFPSLKDAKIDYAWSGNFALTLTRFPQMGRLGDNLLFSHGCSGHGVTTTHLLGRLLAEAVTGDPTRFNIIANLPYYPFPGGRLFRVPATIAGSWYYRARDALGL